MENTTNTSNATNFVVNLKSTQSIVDTAYWVELENKKEFYRETDKELLKVLLQRITYKDIAEVINEVGLTVGTIQALNNLDEETTNKVAVGLKHSNRYESLQEQLLKDVKFSEIMEYYDNDECFDYLTENYAITWDKVKDHVDLDEVRADQDVSTIDKDTVTTFIEELNDTDFRKLITSLI